METFSSLLLPETLGQASRKEPPIRTQLLKHFYDLILPFHPQHPVQLITQKE